MPIHTGRGERLTKLRELMRTAENDLDVYVIPSEDQHGGDYTAACDKRLGFICGFHGSGYALITMDEAMMFTEGRYFLQAEQQMDENWTLMKQGLKGVPTWQEYLGNYISLSSKHLRVRIGVDPTLIPNTEVQSLTRKHTNTTLELIPIQTNLVDAVWGTARPPRTRNAIYRLDETFTGENVESKLRRLRESIFTSNAPIPRSGASAFSGRSDSESDSAESLKKNGPATGIGIQATTTKSDDTKRPMDMHKALIITSLDDIAWLFNLRGSDIEFCPVFFSYAVVHFDSGVASESFSTSQHPSHPESGNAPDSDSAIDSASMKTSAVLFLQHSTHPSNSPPGSPTARETETMAEFENIKNELQLGKVEVDVKAYEDVWSYLTELGKSSSSHGLQEKQARSRTEVLLPDTASWAVARALGQASISTIPSPITSLKAIKNAVQLQGIRECHLRDAVALARYFAWLEERLMGSEDVDKAEVSESEGAEHLESYRSQLPLFKGSSFGTISCAGPNGAMVLYNPDPKDCSTIRKDQIYLCDCGAQFLDGTTDVCRTWHFGNGPPTAEEKRIATRVLQGHIAIDCAVFPSGTTGYVIDSWARRALWKDGLDFRHGTGHGVGHFLNVVEGPHGIGTRNSFNSHPLKPGMVVSNEPGCYIDGKFGVRIENVLVVKEVQPDTGWNFGEKGWLGFECVTWCPIQTKLVDERLLSVDEKQWLDRYHAHVWKKVSPSLKEIGDERALKWLERECRAIE